jgi:hypothetical protein
MPQSTPGGEPTFTLNLIELGIRPSILRPRTMPETAMTKTLNPNASEVEKLHLKRGHVQKIEQVGFASRVSEADHA